MYGGLDKINMYGGGNFEITNASPISDLHSTHLVIGLIFSDSKLHDDSRMMTEMPL